MSHTSKAFEIALGAALALTTQLFAAAGASVTTQPKTPSSSAAATKSKSAPKRPRIVYQPVPNVDLGAEKHYAALFENGVANFVSQSDNFDLTERMPAASHMKLLTAATVLDAMKDNPALDTARNRGLLHAMLIRSDNWAADEILKNVAIGYADPVDMLRAQAKKIGLSDQVVIINACGDPTPLWRGGPRQESFLPPGDDVKVAAYLVEHHLDFLKDLWSSVAPNDGATSPLFYSGTAVVWPPQPKPESIQPSSQPDNPFADIMAQLTLPYFLTPAAPEQPKPGNQPPLESQPSGTAISSTDQPSSSPNKPVRKIVMGTKTGTDESPWEGGNNHSTIVFVIFPDDKALIVYHHHTLQDMRSPFAVAADLVKEVMTQKMGIPADAYPEFSAHLDDISDCKAGVNRVGKYLCARPKQNPSKQVDVSEPHLVNVTISSGAATTKQHKGKRVTRGRKAVSQKTPAVI